MGKRLFSLTTDPYLADHQLEGTPFVPFVVLAESLLELATAIATPSAGFRLADLRLETPLMLRKGREREVEFACTPSRLEIRDGAGRPLCTATTATGRHPFGAAPPRVTTPPVLAWLRRSLYPAILLHGPTFQADLQVVRFSPVEAVFAWTGIDPHPASLARFGPDRAAACVLGDLALQAAGLTMLGRRRGYTLPWGAAGYERPVPLAGAATLPGGQAVLPGRRETAETMMPEGLAAGRSGSVAAGMPLLPGDLQAFPGRTDRAPPAAGAAGITCRVTVAPDGKLDAEAFTADGRALVCWLGLDLRPVGLSISGPAQGLIEALAALQEVAA